MGYYEVVFDSERRTPGTTRDRAGFDWNANMLVRSMSLKFFGTTNPFGSTLPTDYVIIGIDPFNVNGSVLQPVPDGTGATFKDNQSAQFLVPYDVAVTKIIWKESTDFIQENCYGNGQNWNRVIITVGHNNTTVSSFTLGAWLMVVGVETE